MNYKVIGDSCCDFTPALKADPHFTIVPLTLEIGDYSVVDDDHFDQLDFLKRVHASPIGPKTACPSPETYMKAMEDSDADEVYVITLSEHLSGSYQAAVIGKQMYEEEHPDDGRKIHIFSSDTAAAGQLNLCMAIQDLKELGKSFDEVVTLVSEKIQTMKTYFVLESLDTLRKNGRLSTVKAFIASALNIKPIMAGDHGVIVQVENQRGINKALKRMAQIAVEKVGGPAKTADLRLCITHVNNPARAEFVKEEFQKLAPFREIVITDAMGVATVYAEDGGIVIGL